MSARELDAFRASAGAALRVRYLDAPLDTVLADRQVLAVLAFGRRAPATHSDPRYFNTGLEALGESPPFEVWYAHGPVECGRSGTVAWSRDGDLCFGALAVAEADHGGPVGAATAAYARLLDSIDGSDHPFLLRVWNLIDAINDGEGDDERYRQFCLGRAIGMQDRLDYYPAATAVGLRDGQGTLRIYWLAGRVAGRHIENPRQVAAWRYPRQYGPRSPSFSRATLAATAAVPLLLSGTASVVGHATVHPGDAVAQVRETLDNLSSLLREARQQRASLSAALGQQSLLKVYVRDASATDVIAGELLKHVPADTPRLFVEADICRADLCVEIDGFHD